MFLLGKVSLESASVSQVLALGWHVTRALSGSARVSRSLRRACPPTPMITAWLSCGPYSFMRLSKKGWTSDDWPRIWKNVACQLILLMMVWLGGIGGRSTQKVAAARLGMISAAVKHRREKMKRLGMSGWT